MKKFFFTFLAITVLCHPISAANITWRGTVGTTKDATLNTNWNPSIVPTSSDTAILHAHVANHSPYILNPGGVTYHLSVNEVQFTGSNTFYIGNHNIAYTLGSPTRLTIGNGGIYVNPGVTGRFIIENGHPYTTTPPYHGYASLINSGPAGSGGGTVKIYVGYNTDLTRNGVNVLTLKQGQTPGTLVNIYPQRAYSSVLKSLQRVKLASDMTLNIIYGGIDTNPQSSLELGGVLTLGSSSGSHFISMPIKNYAYPYFNYNHPNNSIRYGGIVKVNNDGVICGSINSFGNANIGTTIQGGYIYVEPYSNLGQDVAPLIFDGGNLYVGIETPKNLPNPITVTSNNGSLLLNGFNPPPVSNLTQTGTTNNPLSGTGVLTIGNLLYSTSYPVELFLTRNNSGFAGSFIIDALTTVTGIDDYRSIPSVDIMNNGTLDFAQGVSNVVYGGDLSGTGNVEISNATTVEFTSTNNTYSGGTTVSGGSTLVGNGNNFPQGTSDTITLQTTSDTLHFIQTSNNTYAGKIAGSGEVIKDGTGTLFLTNSNTYTGNTILAEGTLNINSDAALGVGGILEATANGVVLQAGNTLSSSRTIDIDNGLLFIMDSNGFDMEWDGQINGTGSVLEKTGAGTLFLSGVKAYSGGTIINEGTLQIDNDGSLGASNTPVTVTGPSTLQITQDVVSSDRSTDITGQSFTVDTQSFDLAWNGVITGAGGSLIKNGTGKFFLKGTNTYSGPTTVHAGEFNLNGSITSSVTVDQGSIFSGNATVFGDMLVAGTISPGNSIGLIDIGGNYSQTSTSFYIVELIGNENDLINISGLATLAGTLSIIEGPVLFNYVYTILHADGGVIGTYSNVINSGNIAAIVVYDPNDVRIIFRQSFIKPTFTCNQMCLANRFNQIANFTADQITIFNSLINLNSGATAAAFDEMSGSQYTFLIQMDRYGNERFNRRIYNALRNNLSASNCLCSCDPVTTWFEFEGGKNFIKGDINSAGLKAWNTDYSLGAYFCPNNNFLIGIAGNYQIDGIDFKQGGNSHWNTAQGSVYAAYQNNLMYVFADGILGNSWGKFHRNINFSTIFRTAKSRPKTELALGYAELGANYSFCNVLFQPFVAYEFGAFHQRRIVEHGADSLNLTVRKKELYTNDIYLGAHFTTLCLEWFTLNADLAWQHRFGNSAVNSTNSFSDFGSSCTIEGVKVGNDGILGTVNISKTYCDNFTLYGSFTGERWKRWSSYGLDFGINLSF